MNDAALKNRTTRKPPTNACASARGIDTNSEDFTSQIEDLRQSLQFARKECDHYMDLFEYAPVGYICMNSNGVLQGANVAATQLLGLERHKLPGSCFDAFLAPDDKDTFHDYLQRVFDSKEKLDIELEIQSPSGTGVTVHMESLTGPGSDSVPMCRTVITDISASKRIQQEIINQRDLAKRLIEVAPAIVLVLDTVGKIVQVNDYFERLTGYMGQDIVGMDWISNFVPAAEQNHTHAVFSDSINGKRTRGNINNVVTSTGAERTIEWFDTELISEQGALIGILAIGQDITDCVEAQRRQRESEYHLHLVADAMPVFIAQFDMQMRYRFHNKHHMVWFDLPDEQINGKHIKEVFGDAAFRILEPLINQVLSGRNISDVVEMELDCCGKCFFLVNFIPDYDIEHKVNGFVAMMTDFTDVKNQEIAIKQRLMTLAQDSRLNSLGEMVSEIAHELNQPLTVISNYCDAILRLRKSGKDQKRDVDGVLTEILSQVTRAGQIIKHIRQFTQQRELQLEKTACNELVLEVIQLLRDQIRQHDVELILDLFPTTRLLLIDRVLIQQVIINLIENALDAMQNVNDRRRILTLRSDITPEDEVVLEIRDTGSGLSGEAEQDVFKPFFTTKQNGMGLGLAMSRSIIESHQGTLTAKSNGDTGSIFTVTLPYNVD